MSAEPQPAVRAADLVKTFRAGRDTPAVRALDGLSLSIPAGTVFGLLGPNGAGKSTTVKILATLSRPDAGTAVVAGHDVLSRPERVRRAIGLVSQASSSDPMSTGRENLVLAGRIQGLSRRGAQARAGDLLDRFGLGGDAADRLAKTYSGGMARKLDVAIGLVHRPAVLFLDEPTTGLDPQARAEMWAEITRLSADEHVTVVLTTHYLEEADRLAQNLAIVDAGRIAVVGTPDALKSELHGDTVHVELANPADGERARARLARVAALRDIGAEGARLRARADSGARAVLAALAALEQAGIEVSSATVARPSLDDVYLRHVGHSYRSDDRAGAAA